MMRRKMRKFADKEQKRTKNNLANGSNTEKMKEGKMRKFADTQPRIKNQASNRFKH